MKTAYNFNAVLILADVQTKCATKISGPLRSSARMGSLRDAVITR
jgi:hypothetical protein